MERSEDMKGAYGIAESMDIGFCKDPCKMPLPEYCDICTHALEINPGCYYCMLNDKYV